MTSGPIRDAETLYLRIMEAEEALPYLQLQQPTKDFSSLGRLINDWKDAALSGDLDAALALCLEVEEEAFRLKVPGFNQERSDC